ncbi:coiled-coil domain-containing protein [Peptostreptococcus faecalis]|uniref:hypothetical protein n=1 Tax=Peptostreptococcus faecalis TaxID=2045015 RepID=UPI000C7B6898|nr:hypothetical protein [Peptostreptococcus faecalis]
MISDNSPSLGWIRVTGTVVTYRNKIYYVPDDFTEKKYIYWDAEQPGRFIFSNTILNESTTRFLVLINKDGQHTITHSKNEYFNISFGASKLATVEKKIYGMYEEFQEENGKNTTKFSNITQTLDKINQTVGSITTQTTSIEESISQINQTANDIILEVKNTKKTFSNNILKDNINQGFMDLMSGIGVFQMAMERIMADEKKDFGGGTEEQDEIDAHISKLTELKEELFTFLREVAKSEDLSDDILKKLEKIENPIIPEINIAEKNLKDIIEGAGQDRNYSPSDRKSIYEFFAKYISVLNQHKNYLDEVLILGTGGKISEIIGKMFLDSSKGGFSFSEKINGIVDKQSEFKVSLDGIETKLSDKVSSTEISILRGEIRSKVSDSDFQTEIKQLGDKITSKVSSSEVTSIIEQNPKSIKLAFNKIDSASAVFDDKGLTINKGFVAVDCLTVPNNHEPIINLFTDQYAGDGFDPKIDARKTGNGKAIRLQYSSYHYIYVGNNTFDVYLNGGDRGKFSVKELSTQDSWDGTTYAARVNNEHLATRKYVNNYIGGTLRRNSDCIYIEVDGKRVRFYPNKTWDIDGF